MIASAINPLSLFLHTATLATRVMAAASTLTVGAVMMRTVLIAASDPVGLEWLLSFKLPLTTLSCR
jgi:hypothetical protein